MNVVAKNPTLINRWHAYHEARRVFVERIRQAALAFDKTEYLRNKKLLAAHDLLKEELLTSLSHPNTTKKTKSTKAPNTSKQDESARYQSLNKKTRQIIEAELKLSHISRKLFLLNNASSNALLKSLTQSNSENQKFLETLESRERSLLLYESIDKNQNPDDMGLRCILGRFLESNGRYKDFWQQAIDAYHSWRNICQRVGNSDPQSLASGAQTSIQSGFQTLMEKLKQVPEFSEVEDTIKNRVQASNVLEAHLARSLSKFSFDNYWPNFHQYPEELKPPELKDLRELVKNLYALDLNESDIDALLLTAIKRTGKRFFVWDAERTNSLTGVQGLADNISFYINDNTNRAKEIYREIDRRIGSIRDSADQLAHKYIF